MSIEDRAKLEAELVDLTRKATVRRNVPGYAQNVEAIDARIAEIEAQLAAPVEP